MSKIELNEQEIKVIEMQLNGEFDQFDSTEEEQGAMTSVMEKAQALMDELEAYEESGDDVVKWFYEKYKSQSE
jgi:hypothetical protein